MTRGEVLCRRTGTEKHLYTQEGRIDDEVAGVVKNGVGARGLGVGHQLSLARQAPPKIELQGLGFRVKV